MKQHTSRYNVSKAHWHKGGKLIEMGIWYGSDAK